MTDNDQQQQQQQQQQHQHQPQERGNQPANSPNTDHPPTTPPNASADNPTSPSASLSSRIQSSAHGLARSAFSSSAGDASLLAGGVASKASPSASASRQTFSAAQRFDEAGAPSSSGSAREHASSLPGESFRSEPAAAATTEQGGFALPAFSEEEFQASYGSDPWADAYTPRPGEEPTHTASVKGKAPDADAVLSPTPLPTDGLAVSHLLATSSFDPEFPHEPFDPVETDLSQSARSQRLSPDEIQMIESFRRQMTPPPGSHSQSQTRRQQGQHRLTPYSLVPGIETILNSASVWEPAEATGTGAGAGAGAGAETRTAPDATALRDTVLANLPGSAEWIAVDERYHDEVWGYLRPALEAAREEIEARSKEGGEAGTEEDGPAVRRLKMILKHMGGV